MPNLCSYNMKIKGTKENCLKWVDKMNSYEEPNHFYRIFEADIYEEDEEGICVYGDCAWSIESCCRASGYSEGVDLLEVNSRELGLVVEIFSEEPGMCFAEHYIYNNGKCLRDECINFESYYYDEDEWDSFEDFKKEMELDDSVTIDDLDDGNNYIVGGYGDCDFEI